MTAAPQDPDGDFDSVLDIAQAALAKELRRPRSQIKRPPLWQQLLRQDEPLPVAMARKVPLNAVWAKAVTVRSGALARLNTEEKALARQAGRLTRKLFLRRHGDTMLFVAVVLGLALLVLALWYWHQAI